ncbi:hypothetical protein Csa_004390, partial [Cucumis sativus]
VTFKLRKAVLITVDVATACSHSINDFFPLFYLNYQKQLNQKTKLILLDQPLHSREMWAVGDRDPEKSQQKWNSKRSFFQPVGETAQDSNCKLCGKNTTLFVFLILNPRSKRKKKYKLASATKITKEIHDGSNNSEYSSVIAQCKTGYQKEPTKQVIRI